MKKASISIGFAITLLLTMAYSNTSYAQAGKKADSDTKIWRYEVQCVGVGVQGSKLIKVFSYSAKPDIAIEQAKKNAIHAAIFQGWVGNGMTGCETQKPLTDNPNLEQEKADFFASYFADGGKYAKFVSITGDGSIAAEDRMKIGKEFKIGVIVSVMYDQLRKDLEAAGIIPKLEAPAGTTPVIMFYPSNTLMKTKGFVKKTENQGIIKESYDLDAALVDKEFSAVLSTLNSMMNERGLGTVDLASKLQEVNDLKAIQHQSTSENNGGIAESDEDLLLKTAKPDIKINVTFDITTSGPNKSIHFQLDAVDAGTNAPCGNASGDGKGSFSATIYVLLKEAVLQHIDNFNSQLMASFQKTLKDGKEISLEISVYENSPKKLNDEINDEGDQLKDDIIKWVRKNTVNHAPNLGASSPRLMKFTGVRIPVNTEDGPNDANSFATQLRKYLRKTHKLDSETSAIGLGKGLVIIGGKAKQGGEKIEKTE